MLAGKVRIIDSYHAKFDPACANLSLPTASQIRRFRRFTDIDKSR
jgi:hypothetical protein